MKEIKNLAILNLLFYTVAFLISNLSQLKIFSELTNGDVSNKYDSVFAPAPFTFSIWGFIYLSLFAFTIYHAIKAFKTDEHSEANQILLKIGYLFVLNNIAIALWIFAFVNEWLLSSVVLMMVQLLTLIIISVKLNLFNIHKSLANKAFTQFSLSIYFAWICVATIANISAYLVSIKWDGFGITETNWAMIMLTIAFLLAVFMILVKRNPFFGMVVLWATYGIKAKNEINQSINDSPLFNLCYFYIGALIILILLQFYKNYRLKVAVLN